MQYFAYSQKAFIYKYVVMLSDTDQFRHMSFANYLKLMFLATDALFVGFLNEEFLADNRFQLVNSRMQFKKQTIAGENILVKVNSTDSIGERHALLYTFVVEGSGELVGLGYQEYQLSSFGDEAVKSAFKKEIENLLKPIYLNSEYLLYTY